MAAPRKILLGVCGSIAAYKACDITRRLMENGCQVDVAMTAEAAKLVSPTTFAALSGRHVYADMWDQQAWSMSHIELARQADVFLIAPATANTIAKIAHGFADDPVCALALTVHCPIIMAPAMNEDMFNNVAVKENIATLKKRGVQFIEPIVGQLACGVNGVGHLADVGEILKVVLK